MRSRQWRLFAAVIWNLTVIREAAGRVPTDVTEANRQIPWSRMRAVRNVVCTSISASMPGSGAGWWSGFIQSVATIQPRGIWNTGDAPAGEPNSSLSSPSSSDQKSGNG